MAILESLSNSIINNTPHFNLSREIFIFQNTFRRTEICLSYVPFSISIIMGHAKRHKKSYFTRQSAVDAKEVRQDTFVLNPRIANEKQYSDAGEDYAESKSEVTGKQRTTKADRFDANRANAIGQRNAQKFTPEAKKKHFQKTRRYNPHINFLEKHKIQEFTTEVGLNKAKVVAHIHKLCDLYSYGAKQQEAFLTQFHRWFALRVNSSSTKRTEKNKKKRARLKANQIRRAQELLYEGKPTKLQPGDIKRVISTNKSKRKDLKIAPVEAWADAEEGMDYSKPPTFSW